MNENDFLEQLKKDIAPLREQIIHHEVYAKIQTIEHLQIFMEHHVYAVWDFMSLLKGLQRNLTCVSIPWVPVGNANTRFLINEIVVGEESDVDQNGNRCSHFELYLKAMEEAGCSLSAAHTFIDKVSKGETLEDSFEQANIPAEARDFVLTTFDTVVNASVATQAAVFTFGREDLIPGMFISFVHELHKHNPEKLSTMIYYLERHIEVDGGHHSNLAYQMTLELCEQDEEKWRNATKAIKQALQKRIQLWDAISQRISESVVVSA